MCDLKEYITFLVVSTVQAHVYILSCVLKAFVANKDCIIFTIFQLENCSFVAKGKVKTIFVAFV